MSGKISVSLEVGVADTAFYSSGSPVFVMSVSLMSSSVGFTSECLLTDAAPPLASCSLAFMEFTQQVIKVTSNKLLIVPGSPTA